MIRRLFENGKQFLVTLRFSILTIFITLFITMVVLIIIVTSRTFSDELIYTATKLMGYASKDVVHQITDGLTPAERDSRFTAYFIKANILATNQESLIPYTLYLLKNYPLFVRVYWADAAGNFISSEKQPDGTISSNIYDRSHIPNTHTVIYRDLQGNIRKTVVSTDMNFDVRMISIFKQAATQQSFFWTPVHQLQIISVMGMSAITPIYQDNHFASLVGINIGLDYLSAFLTKQKITSNSYSFIINTNEDLVAFPHHQPFTDIKSLPGKLINVHDIKLPVVDVSLDNYKKTGKQVSIIKYDGKKYLASFLPGPTYSHSGSLVGVIAPLLDFTEPLTKMNFVNLLLTLLILCIGILLVSNLVTRVVRPVKRLVKEADRIKKFDLDHHIYFFSRIKEVVLLRNAFESMRLGLRQFQRYVPKMLVRQLIESGNDTNVGGVRKELVVFFSDIKNFTQIAEKMDPNQLMFQVCDYFEALTTIIIDENKGTLDKYIGDAVMAFWGAPIPERHPCYLAARAALQCYHQVEALNEGWQATNKPAFETYFGIHMGIAIVGNVGSSERLNYTALGDTINTASRLEDINRTYGTHILVSDVVYENIKNDFALRLIDQVTVRGRFEPIYIYELLAERADELSFDLAAYDKHFAKGFAAYQAKNWQAAKNYFEKCLVIYPADTIAPIFIRRMT